MFGIKTLNARLDLMDKRLDVAQKAIEKIVESLTYRHTIEIPNGYNGMRNIRVNGELSAQEIINELELLRNYLGIVKKFVPRVDEKIVLVKKEKSNAKA